MFCRIVWSVLYLADTRRHMAFAYRCLAPDLKPVSETCSVINKSYKTSNALENKQAGMEEENVFEVSIPGTRDVKNKYTEYEIVCITNNKNFRRCYVKVFRRYSDFYKLHSKLRCFIKVLPEFPRKKWNKLSKEVVEERIRMLTVYLKFVCDYILKQKKNSEKVSADVIGFMQDDDLKTC